MNWTRMTACVSAAVLMITPLTSCSRKNKTDLTPLMGLKWFEDKSDVMDALQHLTLVNEREKDDESAKQYYVDYNDASLLEHDCSLTVCFTEQGFVGLNYHDTNRMNTYRQWYTALEDIYGTATEQGSGMASWYENPVGKDTALYLFNLEEGVQVSFYTSAGSPDKSYKGKEKEKKKPNIIYVPEPELRTPVVPVVDEVISTNAVQNNVIEADTDIVYVNEDGILVTDMIVKDENGEAVVDEEGETIVTAIPVVTTVVTDEKGKEITTQVTNEKGKPVLDIAATDNKNVTVTTTTTTAYVTTDSKAETEPATEPVTEPVVIDHKGDFLVKDLSFYCSPDTGRSKMSVYTQNYEYRSEETGEPWEIIMEYERVKYLGKRCDLVLCFTSLGLVGMNYYDSNANNYDYWVQKMKEIYGTPSEAQSEYTAWYDDPVGSGTMIYVLALEDGVQISFFADDTGSELAK